MRAFLISLLVALAVAVSTAIQFWIGGGFTSNLFSADQSFIPGDQIEEKDLAWLRENELLIKGETPILLHKASVWGIRHSGSLLTDQYVGAWTNVIELQSWWLRLGRICTIEETAADGNIFRDAYRLEGIGGDEWLRLDLSSDSAANEVWMNEVERRNDKATTDFSRLSCDLGRDAAALDTLVAMPVDQRSIDQRHRAWLIEKEWLNQKERVLWFNSNAYLDLTYDGTLITAAGFGSWFEQDDGEILKWWMPGESICAVAPVKTDDLDAEYDTVEVRGEGGQAWRTVEIAKAVEGVPDFLKQLNKVRIMSGADLSAQSCDRVDSRPAEPVAPSVPLE